MTALALLGIAPDTVQDRLEAARAAQSWTAVAIAVVVAILLFWLVSRLGDDDEAVQSGAHPASEPVEQQKNPGVAGSCRHDSPVAHCTSVGSHHTDDGADALHTW